MARDELDLKFCKYLLISWWGIEFYLKFFSFRFAILCLRIKGTTGVEIASGLHWYLKYKCNAHVSWDKTGGIQVASVPQPGHLPRIDSKRIFIRRPVPWNYYQNVVTSSCKIYTLLGIKSFLMSWFTRITLLLLPAFLFFPDSYVWWGWERWEREIDWMALQGINLPLAFTGQEAIWQKVFKVKSQIALVIVCCDMIRYCNFFI